MQFVHILSFSLLIFCRIPGKLHQLSTGPKHASFSKYSASKVKKQLKSLQKSTGQKWILQGDMLIPKYEFDRRIAQPNRVSPLNKSFKIDGGEPVKKWNQHPRNGRFEIGFKSKKEWFENSDLYHTKGEWKKFEKELRKAIEDFESKTSLKFVDISENSSKKWPHWIQFIGYPNSTSDLSGCQSYLGRQGDPASPIKGDGGQSISLGVGCVSKTNIIHEIMHALGWVHEQNRPDRDDYVEIIDTAIKGGPKGTYSYEFIREKRGNTSGSPYDFSSIMHYHEEAFSSHGEKTIISRNPRKNKVTTQRDYDGDVDSNLYKQGLSNWDAFEINSQYDLKLHCKERGKYWYFLNNKTGKLKHFDRNFKYRWTPTDTCIDDNSMKSCADNPCGQNRICINLPEKKRFECKPRQDPCDYENHTKEVKICLKNGQCASNLYTKPVTVSCICESGFMSKWCDREIICKKKQQLILQNGFLARICKDFDGLKNSETLNLSGMTDIKRIGNSAFKNIDTLRSVNLQRSSIRSIDTLFDARFDRKGLTAFNALKSLKKLDFSSNFLSEIPSLAFDSNYRLKNLNLANNKLEGELSAQLFRGQLEFLFLNNNPNLVMSTKMFRLFLKDLKNERAVGKRGLKKLWIHNTNKPAGKLKTICRVLVAARKSKNSIVIGECCYETTLGKYGNEIRKCIRNKKRNK